MSDVHSYSVARARHIPMFAIQRAMPTVNLMAYLITKNVKSQFGIFICW